MTDSPRVTVITIFFNAERFFDESIRSVLGQSYNNWELLLVDDGSTDGSTEIAQRYAAEYPGRIRYLEHEGHVNRGMSATRNLGVRHAQGEWIALLDSDDVWLPQKLDEQLEILRLHPQATMVFGAAHYWNSWPGSPYTEEPDYFPELGMEADRCYAPRELTPLIYPLGAGDPPCPSDFLMHREMLSRVGGFEEHFRGKYHLYEDQAFLSKVYLTEHVYISSQNWIRYRLHPDSCCAAAQRADDYHDVRRYFLHWFQEYLEQGKLSDPQIDVALQQALHPYLEQTLS
ncbi:MAG: glycosyltransferase [Planctomycetaceae bacterium]|nr:glycosyltransferase [Planctomycetaceae bacterium]